MPQSLQKMKLKQNKNFLNAAKPVELSVLLIATPKTVTLKSMNSALESIHYLQRVALNTLKT